MCSLKVIRDGGSVGAVEVSWMINSSDQSQQSAGRHQFVTAAGTVSFSNSQRSANLSVGIINDMLPSLDTSYHLILTNVSQVTNTCLAINSQNRLEKGAISTALPLEDTHPSIYSQL